MNKRLPPRRNIFGDPIILQGGLGPDLISPIYVSADRKDAVADEMVRLKLTPSMPDRKIGGVELTPQQYDEYAQLAGKPLRPILQQIIASPRYAKAPDFIKVKLLNETLSRVLEEATRQLQVKYPDLLAAKARSRIGLPAQP